MKIELPEVDHPHADWSSEFPFTLVCPACGYVGWPNTTDLPGRGHANYCPRSRHHGAMVQIRITDFEVVE